MIYCMFVLGDVYSVLFEFYFWYFIYIHMYFNVTRKHHLISKTAFLNIKVGEPDA